MPSGIRLKFFEPRLINVFYAGAFRLRVEASDGDGLDSRIFVYSRSPLDPYTQTHTDRFENVCGPVDLAEIPPDNPDPTQRYPYLRKNFVELDVRSTLHAEQVQTTLRQRIQSLLDAIDRLNDLQLTHEVWLGQAPDNDSDDSFGSDASSSSLPAA